MEKKNNGFLIGLICGLIIGAIVAVVIYKNNKTKVFETLKSKLGKSFKKPVTESPVVIKKPPIKKPKMFVKPKKRV